jgi:cytidylate kinase
MKIAIDGPAGAGKGTLAKRLSAHYDLPYLDTGLLYRAVGKLAMDQQISPDETAALEGLVDNVELSELNPAELRTQEIGSVASKIAVVEGVRDGLLRLQREFLERPGGGHT